MESKKIFEMALNVTNPWYIEDVKMSKAGDSIVGQVNIYINFKVGSKFKDSSFRDCAVHDTVNKTWQHLNFFEHQCFIHARVPRIRTSENKVELVQVPWSRPGSGFTLMYEAFGMLLIESEMPVKKAAKVIKIHDTRLWRIFDYWVKRASMLDEQKDIKHLGIDETSIRKGHNYVTIAVDMDKRRVVYATAGKDKQTIESLKNHLQMKDCSSEQIQNICIDMSPSFIAGCAEHFQNANITFDKFHIMKLINEAMDKVQRQERKQHIDLKGYKYLFLKNQESLSQAEIESKTRFIELYEPLGKAYQLKELFKDFWTLSTKEEASGYLAYWCDAAEESKLMPFINVANTIKRHWIGIVNYIKSKMNNGILEGINSKIQLAKKRARGFRNTNNFINMIYFVAGKLKFDYPLYLA